MEAKPTPQPSEKVLLQSIKTFCRNHPVRKTQHMLFIYFIKAIKSMPADGDNIQEIGMLIEQLQELLNHMYTYHRESKGIKTSN